MKKLNDIKIVHASTSGNMLTAFGRSMANKMANEGATIYYVASSKVIYGRCAVQDDFDSMKGELKTVPLDNSVELINVIKNIFILCVILKKINPQVMHTRGSVMGLVGRISAWLCKIPCVVHHQDDLYSRDSKLSPFSKSIYSYIERFLANRTDLSFVVSQSVFEAAIASGFDSSKLLNVGHDFNPLFLESALNNSSMQTEFLLSRFGINNTDFVVGSIARFESHKSIDILIDAYYIVASKYPNIRLIIRGRGPEKKNLLAQIERLNLANKIVLIDEWLDSYDLISLFRSFDIFALPTKREGFGMVFAEAMLLGAVPIAPNIAPMNEVVTSKSGYLVEANPESFADAIISAYENPEDLESKRNFGHSYAVDRWGGDRSATLVIDQYLKVLTNKTLYKPRLRGLD